MRTRNLPMMINSEVEQYLQRGDVLIVPVGVTETHGGLPLNCETILAEAIASKMADACDGLFMTGLNYFFPGCTTSGRGTVLMSVESGAAYLKKLAYSFLRQGFRRQIYVTFHAPSYLTVGTVVRDFFDETNTPILYIDGGKLMGMVNAENGGKRNPRDHFDLFLGAYKIMNCLNMVPLNVPEDRSVKHEPYEQSISFIGAITKLGPQSGALGHFINVPSDHVPTPVIASAEEREAGAQHGIEMIEKMVKAADMENTIAVMRKIDKYNQEVIIPNNPWLPGNR